mmetsp:Transcript_3489/g.7655  ORF Transcript_3489/g.7655 Transcript_3489/m.7655 type:complete len:83 (+) Transcript_3489:144-392(+)
MQADTVDDRVGSSASSSMYTTLPCRHVDWKQSRLNKLLKRKKNDHHPNGGTIHEHRTVSQSYQTGRGYRQGALGDHGEASTV